MRFLKLCLGVVECLVFEHRILQWCYCFILVFDVLRLACEEAHLLLLNLISLMIIII